MTLTRLGLTARQRELLNFIKWYVEKNGHSPSYEEMRAALDLSSRSGVHRLIHGLRDRGYVDLRSGAARSVILTEGAA